MNNTQVMFSRNTDEWATPQDLFDELNKEFCFDLDPCSTDDNHKCEMHYTKEQNGLNADWGGHRVFCNPPYSDIAQWVAKCYEEGRKENTLVCMLIPSRTDTRYFHDYILNRAEIRFVKGRLKFGESTNSAPFPSMLVIFYGAKVKVA